MTFHKSNMTDNQPTHFLKSHLSVAMLSLLLAGVAHAAEATPKAGIPAAKQAAAKKSQPKAAGGLQLTGRMQRAIRFIDAPVFDLSSPKGVVRYQAKFTDALGNPLEVTSATPEIDLSGIWAKIAPGDFTGTISALDQEGRSIGSLNGKWHKARPFDQSIKPAPLPRPLPEVIERATDFLINYRNPKGHDPTRPAILWHANFNSDDGKVSPMVYPALGHATFIHLLLDYEAWKDATPANAKAARPLARDLADVLLLHRTPAEWPLGNLFYSTSVGGKMGGHRDNENIIPVNSGYAGLALFRLGLADNNAALIQAAWETALALVKVQNPDGSFAFRVNPKTGEVNNPYTSNVMPVVLFWDALLASKISPSCAQDSPAAREKVADARRRVLDWMMAGPWKDYRWEGLYEDVPNQPPYFGLEWNDAAQAVEYVLARPGEFPGQREQALAITRWIEDQFLCWYPDDVPNSLGCVARTPSALEQYRCYQPIDAHTARAAVLFLAVWQATGDESYRARARALAASIAQAQRSNGSISTFWWLRATTEEGKSKMRVAGLDCLRCVGLDARVLLAHLNDLSAP